MNHQTIIVLDFGSQYTQLIARRRETLGVLRVGRPATHRKIHARKPVGSFVGRAQSVSDRRAECDQGLQLGVPVLGICYGIS